MFKEGLVYFGEIYEIHVDHPLNFCEQMIF